MFCEYCIPLIKIHIAYQHDQRWCSAVTYLLASLPRTPPPIQRFLYQSSLLSVLTVSFPPCTSSIMIRKASSLVLVLALAQFIASATAQVGNIQTVAVGENGLVFTPDTITAPVGSVVQFAFYPRNHSVVQGDFNNPCQPLPGGHGFYSGYQVVSSGVAVSLVSSVGSIRLRRCKERDGVRVGWKEKAQGERSTLIIPLLNQGYRAPKGKSN